MKTKAKKIFGAPEEALPPCLACGSERVKMIGQYLNGPRMTIIYCLACGHKATAWAESIPESIQAAREKWENPAAEPLFEGVEMDG